MSSPGMWFAGLEVSQLRELNVTEEFRQLVTRDFGLTNLSLVSVLKFMAPSGVIKTKVPIGKLKRKIRCSAGNIFINQTCLCLRCRGHRPTLNRLLPGYKTNTIPADHFLHLLVHLMNKKLYWARWTNVRSFQEEVYRVSDCELWVVVNAPLEPEMVRRAITYAVQLVSRFTKTTVSIGGTVK